MMTSKAELQAKVERVHAARMKVEELVVAGVDLRSKEAAPIGRELSRSCDDLCAEVGQEILEEVKTE
jgi:hypothetical protein